MIPPAISLQSVRKSYGANLALADVTLTVRRGTCFGLLGPNGAGKSTAMKIVCGVLKPDAGQVSVLGVDVARDPFAARRLVGYVPQDITLYESLTAVDNLQFFGGLYGLRGATLSNRVQDALRRVGLASRARDRVGTYSGGMKRRLNIAAALLHRPQLLILDEPTVGVDPQSRNHILELIRGLRADGVTVVYATHYMEEAEAVCDDVAILDHGRVLTQGALGEVLARHAPRAVYVAWANDAPPQCPEAEEIQAHRQGWVLRSPQPLTVMRRVMDQAESRSIRLEALELMRPSLESVFLSLTGTSLRD
ncbi:ABC transporter ATP-binding protein [Alicyclobacillus macrosporangiidus]|jgi:ABC-2 type transport system ATP-binding protein|uniref:ABC-2 type transport system ATP-binding protein n=1 Tax=Alicyclobacillus macrosporangiidus TaxID=392015 RepID=A0A1I7KKB6_9BACL|nr:ABC transporter ATP-binding protein [Alicyclobacillus macrosporangiidus]SFU97734.1 ABC-2 type transport system ATP-binding protein [Alicyclobacillus macrosporangiidus]